MNSSTLDIAFQSVSDTIALQSRDFQKTIGNRSYHDIDTESYSLRSDGFKDGFVTEVRAMNCRFDNGFVVKPEEGRRGYTIAGWFNRIDYLRCALPLFKGVSPFVTINPINNALLSRSPNKLRPIRPPSKGKPRDPNEELTRDKDIAFLRWLFLDIDPIRPSDTSSTDSELDEALALRDRILEDDAELKAFSMFGRSGNGAWILVRLPDYANNAKNSALVKRTLAGFAAKYNTPRVKIDTSVGNPARIMCCPDTMKCKGPNTSERPWRLSTFDGKGASL